MPKACRITDLITIHECGVIPTALTGSADVFIEGKGAHRQEDSNSSHPAVPEASGCTPHITQLASGSPDIFVNGKPLARVGDSYGCGIELTSGASNVSAN